MDLVYVFSSPIHIGLAHLQVVPHPGDAEANFVWADIKIRFGSASTLLIESLHPCKLV